MERKDGEGRKVDFLIGLPPGAMQLIFQKLDLASLGNLALTSKYLSAMIAQYVLMESSNKHLFTCFKMKLPLGRTQLQIAEDNYGLYILRGKPDLHRIVPSLIEENCRQLGLLVKRISILKPTGERLALAFNLMQRVVPGHETGKFVTFTQGLATFFHQFIKGWSLMECELAARIFSSIYLTDIHCVLEDNYCFGSHPSLELNLRNFLKAFFLSNAINRDSRTVWIQMMVKIFVPLNHAKKIGKLFILATAPIKEASTAAGIQWKDNIEAVPACSKVAFHRFNDLVQSLLNLKPVMEGDLLKIFHHITQVPRKWIPENIASFLIVAGTKVTREYLAFVVRQSIQNVALSLSKTVEKEQLADLGDIIFGLFVMQSRFKKNMNVIFQRMDEVVALLPKTMRKPFFEALWSAISKEIMDINETEDFWSEDSYGHICKVLSSLGVKLLSRGYQHSSEVPQMRSNTEE